MNDQERYWDSKILEWENTIYGSRDHASALERIAAPFRKVLKDRMDMAEELVKDYVPGRVVADVGCGSGIFLMRLLKYDPKKLIGMDIAESAIEVGRRRLTDMGLDESKVRLVAADVRRDAAPLAEADIVTGLGLLDYLDADELAALFRATSGKLFLFARAAEDRKSIKEWLRRLYLRVVSCPGSYIHSKAQTDQALRSAGITEYSYYERRGIKFLTNLPLASSGTS